jgi:hypothetical protein
MACNHDHEYSTSLVIMTVNTQNRSIHEREYNIQVFMNILYICTGMPARPPFDRDAHSAMRQLHLG